jgi:hypothetical protein
MISILSCARPLARLARWTPKAPHGLRARDRVVAAHLRARSAAVDGKQLNSFVRRLSNEAWSLHEPCCHSQTDAKERDAGPLGRRE